MKHIDHIGIAVKDLEASNKLFASLLNTTCYKIEDVPNQQVLTSFFKTTFFDYSVFLEHALQTGIPSRIVTSTFDE